MNNVSPLKRFAGLTFAGVALSLVGFGGLTSQVKASDPNVLPTTISYEGFGKCDGTMGCNSSTGCFYSNGTEYRNYLTTTLCRMCDEPGSNACFHYADYFICYTWSSFKFAGCTGEIARGRVFKDGACAGTAP